jgi:hypothetical protein
MTLGYAAAKAEHVFFQAAEEREKGRFALSLSLSLTHSL